MGMHLCYKQKRDCPHGTAPKIYRNIKVHVVNLYYRAWTTIV